LSHVRRLSGMTNVSFDELAFDEIPDSRSVSSRNCRPSVKRVDSGDGFDRQTS
jgi:hypothetical protein